MYDVIVVGGGPAGLSAALMLGRCRRRILLCDLGQPRNRRSHALHGYLTRDGIVPAQLNALGRSELETYGVELREIGVTDAKWEADRFRVAMGRDSEEARFLLIATGVVDDLPAVTGLDECYGRSVFHCPYCDGWEWRDRKLAVLGRGREAAGMALALKTWSADIVLVTNGHRIESGIRDRLAPERYRRQDGTDCPPRSFRRAALRGGAFGRRAAPREALFFTTGQHPQSDLAMRLGCTLTGAAPWIPARVRHERRKRVRRRRRVARCAVRRRRRRGRRQSGGHNQPGAAARGAGAVTLKARPRPAA